MFEEYVKLQKQLKVEKLTSHVNVSFFALGGKTVSSKNISFNPLIRRRCIERFQLAVLHRIWRMLNILFESYPTYCHNLLMRVNCKQMIQH